MVYRHPWDNASTFLNSIDEKLQILNKKRSKAMSMGDIKIDLKCDSSFKSDYLHMIESKAFSSSVTQPTRATAGLQTIIDHPLTNDAESVITPGVFLYKLADHHVIYCSISSSNFEHTKNREGTYTFRNIHSVDGNKFRKDFESSLMPMMYDITHLPLSHLSLDQHYDHLVSAMSEVIEKHAPLQTASRKQKKMHNKPWLTKGLLVSIKNKQILYKKFFCNNKFGKWYYKKYTHKLTRVKNFSKKRYYNDAIREKKNNPQKLSKFVNSVISSKRSVSSSPAKINNIAIANLDEIAEHFNNYFVEIGHLITKSISTTKNLDFNNFFEKTHCLRP